MHFFRFPFFTLLFQQIKDSKNDPLSVCSRTQKMTLWAYAQGPKKWPFECTLKDPKNDPLSICSRIQKITLWAYAQSLYERTLKDPKNDPLSICSRTQKMTYWAYAQLLFEYMLNHCLSDQKMPLWAYAQGHSLVVHFNLYKNTALLGWKIKTIQ